MDVDRDVCEDGSGHAVIRPARGPVVDALVARVAAYARPGDTVAVLSNGAFGGIHDKLLAALGA